MRAPVRLATLRVQGLRSLTDVSMQLEQGINLFTGANGAGKTSVLEAAFLLSHGRSFRSGARDALLQRGAAGLSVFAQVEHLQGRLRRIGLGRNGPRWEARIDGSVVPLGQLVRECAVVCFDPGAHALLAGGAEERRRYLDWGTFHVEPSFWDGWRRYQRALKQRNALLRSAEATNEALYAPWEHELVESADSIHRQREHYLSQLRPYLAAAAARMLPELGDLELRYRRGWPDDQDLHQALRLHRARDLMRGHTMLGAHRADWALAFEHAPAREHLSRGQEKLAALACVMAQAAHYSDRCGEWPIVCLDDLASELDLAHQQAVVEHLFTAQAQILVTGTEIPVVLKDRCRTTFHVEQGAVTRLL